MDPKISVSFDGEPGISFVQGEDRTFLVAFTNASDGSIIDLTGGTVGISLPQENGGNIKRTSGAIALNPGYVNLAASPQPAINLPDHGLVTGDPVTFTGLGLPAPLAQATNYLVSVIDLDNFALTTAFGAPVTLTSVGSGPFSMQNPSDIVISGATSGRATFSLRSLVSAATADGLAQDFQCSAILGGKMRVVVLKGLLDVIAQSNP